MQSAAVECTEQQLYLAFLDIMQLSECDAIAQIPLDCTSDGVVGVPPGFMPLLSDICKEFPSYSDFLQNVFLDPFGQDQTSSPTLSPTPSPVPSGDIPECTEAELKFYANFFQDVSTCEALSLKILKAVNANELPECEFNVYVDLDPCEDHLVVELREQVQKKYEDAVGAGLDIGIETHSNHTIPAQCEEIVENGIDYYGNDIASFQSSGQHHCTLKCVEHPDCKFWTMNTETKYCWLKTSDVGRSPNNVRISGNRLCRDSDSSDENSGEEKGYDWCLENYDQDQCDDYYYGYDWCIDHYEQHECDDYYYGYDWCIDHYEQH